MAHSSPFNTKANKSSHGAYTCYVHGSIFNWILPGAKTLHNLQLSVSSDSSADMLQWGWQLPVWSTVM